MHRRTPGIVLALAMVVSLLVAACGSGEEATTAPPATAAATVAATVAATAAATSVPATVAPTATPRPTTPPTATPAPVSAGEVKIALASLRTFELLQVGGGAHIFMDPLYDYPVGTTNDGVLDQTSGAASSWSLSPDGKVWTFKIRNGITFHNGDMLTASDLVWTLAHAVKTGSPLSDAGTLRGIVKGNEAPDAATYVVTLDSTNIFFPHRYFAKLGAGGSPCYVLPEKYMKAVGDDGQNKTGIGSGPYKFKSLTVGDRMVFEAVDKHWYYGVPRVKTMTLQLVPEESTRVAQLKTGAIDTAPVGKAAVKPLRDSGLKIFSRTTSGIAQFPVEEQYRLEYPGYGKNPLADPKVRQAILYYAIDRKLIVEKFLAGVGDPTINYPVTLADPAYERIPVPEYSPTRAKQLLAEAGYPNGFEVDHYLWAQPVLPEGLEILEAIDVMWEQVGLKVNRKLQDMNTWRQEKVSGKGYSKPSISGLYLLGTSPTAGVAVGGSHTSASPFNSNYDPDLDRLGKAYASSSTLADYIANGKAYQKRMYDLAVQPVLFTTGETFASSKNIPEKWHMGVALYAVNLEQMAAMRY